MGCAAGSGAPLDWIRLRISRTQRQPGEVEGAATPDVRKHLERALDRACIRGQPLLDTGAGPQHLGGQTRLLGVDVVSKRCACHRLPTRLAWQVDDPEREVSRVSFLMCPFSVRVLVSASTTPCLRSDVLLASLRFVGVSGAELSAPDAFAAFAIAFWAGAVFPITGSGLGVVDAVLIAMLVELGSASDDALVAAALLWRVFYSGPNGAARRDHARALPQGEPRRARTRGFRDATGMSSALSGSARDRRPFFRLAIPPARGAS